jgi:hypothetical protein
MQACCWVHQCCLGCIDVPQQLPRVGSLPVSACVLVRKALVSSSMSGSYSAHAFCRWHSVFGNGTRAAGRFGCQASPSSQSYPHTAAGSVLT